MPAPSPLGSPARLMAALTHLSETIDARAREGDAGASWTARLIAAGPEAVAAKVTEEAAEFAAALTGETDTRAASEAADLIYHLIVGLRTRGVPLDALASALEGRQGQSGLAEKAARPRP